MLNKIIPYKIKGPDFLIQTIRAYQAIMESGIKISMSRDQVPIMLHLSNYFTVKYSVNPIMYRVADVEIVHDKPLVRVGGVTTPLLFSEEVFIRSRSMWQEKRDTRKLFVGLLTEKRKLVLDNYIKEHRLKPNDWVIKNSKNGREFPMKAWDEQYFKTLANTQFCLCPNGDFVWTYRFFEAILCGAIPIVEDECDLYDGFTYYKMKDTKQPVFSRKIQENNYRLAKERLFLSAQAIKSNI